MQNGVRRSINLPSFPFFCYHSTILYLNSISISPENRNFAVCITCEADFYPIKSDELADIPDIPQTPH